MLLYTSLFSVLVLNIGFCLGAVASKVIYSGVATIGRRSQSTDRALCHVDHVTHNHNSFESPSSTMPVVCSAAHSMSSPPISPSAACGADAVDMLPLPPSPHASMQYDDVDDLPLPPPPPELSAGFQESPADARVSRRDVVRNMSYDSASEQAKQLMFSAAVRRAASARRASEISRFGFSAAGAGAGGRRNDGEPTDDDALAASIKQGVKLKKVVSRDRSAPRMPIQHF
jgi:hypothetical protein